MALGFGASHAVASLDADARLTIDVDVTFSRASHRRARCATRVGLANATVIATVIATRLLARVSSRAVSSSSARDRSTRLGVMTFRDPVGRRNN
jgi:hypothetical protein